MSSGLVTVVRFGLDDQPKPGDYYTLYFTDFDDQFEDTPLVDTEGRLILTTEAVRLRRTAALADEKLKAFYEVPEYSGHHYNLSRVAKLTFGASQIDSDRTLCDFVIFLYDAIRGMGLASEYSRLQTLKEILRSLVVSPDIQACYGADPDGRLRFVQCITAAGAAILDRTRIV